MLKSAFNTLAKAKLIYNKKRELYKVVVAFNVHTKIKDNGEIVHLFPTQAKCAYVSGDLLAENLQAELATVLPSVYKQLRTNSVEFVE